MAKNEIMNPPKKAESPSTATLKEVNKHVTKIKTEYSKAEKAFINIACEIAWLYHDNRYKAVSVGCNFEQFCEEQFGFKKTQTYALNNLAVTYGDCDENGVYTIKDQYKSYGQSQLVAMLPLSDTQIAEKIRPDMSVAKIKAIVKELTTVEAVGIATSDNDASASIDSDNNDDNSIIDVDATERNCIELATYSSFKEFENDLEHILQAVSDRFKSGNAKYVNIGIEW